MSSLVHQFDWYQATVPASPEAVIAELLANLPSGAERINGKGFNSFAARADLCHDSEVFTTVMHGGVNPHPNVKATGDHAPALAGVLRHRWRDHRVSRLDVAVDGRGETLFDDVVRLMSEVGRAHRVKGEKIIPDDLDDGSTYYLGGRTSPLRVRCYEKGKQLFKETGDPVWRNFFDWTRIELQVRPEKGFKSVAASMEPEDFWGCGRWTRDLASGILDLQPEAVAMKPTRIADHERAVRGLIQQYGNTLERHAQRLGSWSACWADIERRLGVSDLDQAA